MLEKKRLITKEGLDSIVKKLQQLEEKRKSLLLEVDEARSHGDLRENAEYHSAKQKLDMLTHQLSQLNDSVANCEVPDLKNVDHKKVYFGAKVTYNIIDQDQTVSWKIVGPDEADTDAGSISYTSPIGKALMGKKKGDSIPVNTPKGEILVEILNIEYDAIN